MMRTPKVLQKQTFRTGVAFLFAVQQQEDSTNTEGLLLEI